MIAILQNWNAEGPQPGAGDRLARALGAGLAGSVATVSTESGALFRYDPGAARRAWRVPVTPCGARVAFTGHLDNVEEMQAELGIAAEDPAELYAAGYARWGDRVDERAHGWFATALVWPGQRRVRLMRSAIQAPPLYYARTPDGLVAASLARAVLAGADLPARVDEQKIADSLYLNYADEARSWYADVARVPTGTRIEFDRDGIRCSPFFDIAAIPAVRLPRDEDYVEAARALLLEGTRAALRGRGAPVVSLSGGLDSQAVAAFAVEASGGTLPILGLTTVPDPAWDPDGGAGWVDERAAAAALAERYPAISAETVDCAGAPFDHRLNAMFLMAGAVPRNAASLYWIHAIRARAAQRGCDVLLTGAMGNWSFSFSGAGALPGWLARGRWLRLAHELRAERPRRLFARALLGSAVLPLLPEGLRRTAARRLGGADDWTAIAPSWSKQWRVVERASAMGSLWTTVRPRSTREARQLAFANSMREAGDIRQALELIHGIPMRDPTAYLPLVKFCLAIPDDQYLRDGTSRYLARRMLAGRIPETVLNETRRGRQAADLPLRLVRDRHALRAELERYCQDPAMSARFDLDRLIAAFDAWGEAPESTNAAVLHALPRMLASARFIDFVEGTNRA